MKWLKMILAATTVFAFDAFANAATTTTVHITGSTAFRAAAHKSIMNVLGAGLTYAYTGTDINKADEAIFTQTNFNGTGNTVIVKTSWFGSVGGLQVLIKNFTVPQSSAGVVGGWLVNSTPQSTSGSAISLVPPFLVTFDPPITADAVFSDSFQSSVPPNFGVGSPALIGANGYPDGIVAVVPFVWVAGNGAPANLTNVTNFALQNALAGGTTLAQFTGVAADNGTVIEVVGQDSASGTRLDAFAESQYGIGIAPTQYQPTIIPVSIPPFGVTISSLDPWPAQVTDGISWPSGHEGYPDDNRLVFALNSPGSLIAADNPGVIIGYLGISDAPYVTNGKILTYNGVAYSPAAVQNGEYSFWSYEHIYYRPSYVGTAGQPIVDAIANDVATVTANVSVSGLLLPPLQVYRAVEGGLINLGNPYLVN